MDAFKDPFILFSKVQRYLNLHGTFQHIPLCRNKFILWILLSLKLNVSVMLICKDIKAKDINLYELGVYYALYVLHKGNNLKICRQI